MKLCFIVDFRSPIARNWIEYFIERGHEVHVVSTYPFQGATADLASFHFVPLSFSSLTGNPRVKAYVGMTGSAEALPRGSQRRVASWLRPWLGPIAHALFTRIGPVDVHRHSREVRRIIRRMQPDIVHAMRIPFEGMLAAAALRRVPMALVVSVWGNDLTLFAERYPLIGAATRRTLRRATALHADCYRDARIATSWGLSSRAPAVVLPGSGGVQLDTFHPGQASPELRARWNLPIGRPVIFNPRNIRPKYVRNDTFFASIPKVLATQPDALFVCVGMKANPIAEKAVRHFGVGHAVRLLPAVPRAEMADLFRLSDITVSPSIHDGTPNSLLEGMACGAFPVVGDIESVREWITHAENGLLCDPTDSSSLANAIVRAVEDVPLRQAAAQRNWMIVCERADYAKVMPAAEAFYEGLVGSGVGPLMQPCPT